MRTKGSVSALKGRGGDTGLDARLQAIENFVDATELINIIDVLNVFPLLVQIDHFLQLLAVEDVILFVLSSNGVIHFDPGLATGHIEQNQI